MPYVYKKITLFLLAATSHLVGYTQVGFQKEYGTPSNDQGCFVTNMEGGKVLIGGTVLIGSKQRIQLLKLDSCLNMEFNKEYQENEMEGIGGSYIGTNYFEHLQNNDLILCGYTGSFGGTIGCPFLMRVDKQGKTLWSNAYTNVSGGINWRIIRKSFGGCYYTSGEGYVDAGFSINKIDSLENILWIKKISSENGYWFSPQSIIPLVNDEFVLVANLSLASTTHSIVIFKFDSSGNLIWKRNIISNKYFKNVSLNSGMLINQKIIVCGLTNDFGNYQGFLLSMNLNGKMDLLKTYDFKDSLNVLISTLLTKDGNISILGTSQTDVNKVAGTLIKIDSQGNLKWARRYKDTNNVQFTNHVQVADGGYCLLGNKLNYTKNQDFYFIKVDSLGRSACDYETMDLEVTDRTFKIDTTIKIYDSIITDMVAYPMNMKVKDVAVNERTYCTTQEPFAGIGAALGQDTIIVCDTVAYHIVNYKTNPNSQYYWSTGDTSRTGIIVTQTGMYKLRVVKGQCESMDSVYIVIANMGNIVPAMHDTSGCAGSIIVLKAQLKNGAPNNMYTYYWNTNDTVQTIKVDTTGVYKVTVKNQYGCILYDSAKVFFLDSLQLIAMADTFICKGQSIIRYAKIKGGDAATIIYTWYDINGNVLSNTKSVNTGSLNVTTSYIFSVADRCAVLYDTVIVNVRKPLQVKFTSPIDICRGDIATLFVEGSGGDSLAYTFNWSNGLKKGKSQEVSPLTSTIYKVTLHDNCTLKDDTATIIVNVNNLKAFFDALPQRTTLFQPQITFNNKSINYNSANWYFGDGDSSVSQINSKQVHRYKDTGVYAVKLIVSNSYGCLDSVTNTIIIADTFTCYIPNAFYPKSKFGNNIFYPVINNTKIIDMTIYNRWGELVYKTPDGCEPINGKYISGNDCGAWNGKRMNTDAECERGEYLFMIRFVDSNFKAHDYNGIVYLIR